MISPTSLEGISYAMKSANILADILNRGTNNVSTKYFIKTLGIRFKLLIKKYIKMPFMYNKYLRKIIMKSNLNAIK